MFPLGSDGGFHFRIIWDEELETDIGSNGTDGTGWVGKRQEVTSTALRETSTNTGNISISLGTSSALHSRPTDTQQSCSRTHQCTQALHTARGKSAHWHPLPIQGSIQSSISLGIPSYRYRAPMSGEKFHRYGTIVTTSQKTEGLFCLNICNITLI